MDAFHPFLIFADRESLRDPSTPLHRTQNDNVMSLVAKTAKMLPVFLLLC